MPHNEYNWNIPTSNSIILSIVFKCMCVCSTAQIPLFPFEGTYPHQIRDCHQISASVDSVKLDRNSWRFCIVPVPNLQHSYVHTLPYGSKNSHSSSTRVWILQLQYCNLTGQPQLMMNEYHWCFGSLGSKLVSHRFGPQEHTVNNNMWTHIQNVAGQNWSKWSLRSRLLYSNVQ